MFPENLNNQLKKRKATGPLRAMKAFSVGIDFYSNDYLGLAKFGLPKHFREVDYQGIGSGGSRLMSGTSIRMLEIEKQLAAYYGADSALLFSSGFLANLGLLSCIGTKRDTIIYDQHVHASTREGIRLSPSKSFSFKHNDWEDLEKKLKNAQGETYVAIEGMYSMHGDCPDPEAIRSLQEKYGFFLIVDEAHSVGILGEKGKGWSEEFPEEQIFARVVTFGKAFGFHGGLVLGNEALKTYLVNFSKPFIYTTAPPEKDFQMLADLHQYMSEELDQLRTPLFENINRYNKAMNIEGMSPIKIVENESLTDTHERLYKEGIQIKIIRPPTVEKGKEIIRLCLHNFNTEIELDLLIQTLQNG